MERGERSVLVASLKHHLLEEVELAAHGPGVSREEPDCGPNAPSVATPPSVKKLEVWPLDDDLERPAVWPELGKVPLRPELPADPAVPLAREDEGAALAPDLDPFGDEVFPLVVPRLLPCLLHGLE